MDWVTWKQNSLASFKKYKYALLILLAGIFLMTLPKGEKELPPVQEPTAPTDLQQSLTRILSRVEGAGKVEVLLTQAAGEEICYQTDTDRSRSGESEDIRRDTVLVTNAGREEEGLIRQTIPPTYQGALVLCQGADNAQVKLSIVEAVKSLTGLTADKITVLKMK